MPDRPGELDLLRSRLAAMEQLLDVHERTVREQSDRLETTMLELRERAEEARRAQREAERAAARMRFLADAGLTLASSLDYETTLRSVAELAVQGMADWCVVDLVGDGRAVHRLTVAHMDPTMVARVRELQERYSTIDDENSLVRRVIASGQPVLLPEIAPEVIRAAAKNAEHLRMLESLELGSCVIVPLQARGATLGALTLVRSTAAPPFTEEDLRMAEELAQRAGTAIDHARLVAELERTQQNLEQAAAELEAQTEELQNTVEELESATQDLMETNERLTEAKTEADRARQAAEEANAAKSQFLATMSHELRTPLNAIDGYAELMELGIHGPLTEPQREAVNRVRRAQKRLLSLVNDVLNFARIEAGQILFEYSTVPLARLIASLELVVAPQVASKNLQLIVEPFDESLALHADAEKTEQILLNLVANAIKFTPAGGVIRISAERDGALARVHVTDTGVGIPPDRQAAVFEPFVQVSEGMVRDHGGVGLGLAISRDLARCMSGDIFVRSTPGKGSRFTVVLPLAGADTASRSDPTQARDPTARATPPHGQTSRSHRTDSPAVPG